MKIPCRNKSSGKTGFKARRSFGKVNFSQSPRPTRLAVHLFSAWGTQRTVSGGAYVGRCARQSPSETGKDQGGVAAGTAWEGLLHCAPICSPGNPLSTTVPSPSPFLLGQVLRQASVPNARPAEAPGHCFSNECLEVVPRVWLQILFVVEKLFWPKEFSLPSDFLDRESGTFSCVLFPL